MSTSLKDPQKAVLRKRAPNFKTGEKVFVDGLAAHAGTEFEVHVSHLRKGRNSGVWGWEYDLCSNSLGKDSSLLMPEYRVFKVPYPKGHRIFCKTDMTLRGGPNRTSQAPGLVEATVQGWKFANGKVEYSLKIDGLVEHVSRTVVRIGALGEVAARTRAVTKTSASLVCFWYEDTVVEGVAEELMGRPKA